MSTGSEWSLRRRICAIAAIAITVAWTGGGLALYSSAQREYERMCHDNLANLAATVLSFAVHEIAEVRPDAGFAKGASPVRAEAVATLGKRYAYQIWSQSGELLLRGNWAPERERLAPNAVPGLNEISVDGTERDVFVMRSLGGDMEIQVADAGGEGLQVSSAFTRDFLLAFVLTIVPVLFLTIRLINGALAALLGLARELGTRGTANFAPLFIPLPPTEMKPVITAVNGLLDTVRQALQRERGFTALASHELRTPLASVRLQAQVLARAENARERGRAVEALTANVDRCSRMVTQLLMLARTDALTLDGVMVHPVRLDDACAEVLTDFAEAASRRRITLDCELAVQELAADKVALLTLLRNLVSNAMTYTPDRGTVRIATSQEPGRVVLSVEDSGSGIPEAERERVLERFYRGDSHTGMGVGLGLSIVASIVEAHHAAIRLCDSSFGGLRVEVRFASAG
jgi:signal transduction histidine kinase